MDSPILISLIIPAYNAQDTLNECVYSIVKQTYIDYEIIIVNDGSTDNTQQVIDHYAQQYPGIIKSVTQENNGLGFARNAGIAIARGKYLAFVDSDDFVAPHYFAVIDEALKSQQPDIFIFRYKRVYKRKPGLLEKLYTFSQYQFVGTKVNLDSHPEIICQTENSVWLKAVKREIASGSGFTFSKVRLAEDMKVNLNWLLKADTVIYSNEVLYNYVLDNNYVSTSTKHITDLFLVLQSVCEEYKAYGKFESCYTELEIMFIKHLLVANMRRMKSAKMKDKHAVFLSLRAKLMEHFPNYNNNRYLKQEPFYVRMAVSLSWYFPGIFRIILL